LELRVARPLTLDDIEEAVFVLRSSKTEQLGGKSRVTSIIPNTPRSRAYLGRVLIWIRIRGGNQEDEGMFFLRTLEGREKRLMSSMVNFFWKVVAANFDLPERSLSSKSGKMMGIAILDSLQDGKAPQAASFHKGAAAQNHYRHPAVGVAGTCKILNAEGSSFTTEQIRSMARLNPKYNQKEKIHVETNWGKPEKRRSVQGNVNEPNKKQRWK